MENQGAGAASKEEILKAAQRLADGELVAFPTETVYGLGGDASNEQAIRKIYEAKGRPADHPVIVHVADPQQARLWVRDLPPEAMRLMSAFWPGPLTMVLKKADWVSPMVSGGQDSVGIRCPSHPVAQQLLQAFADLRKGDPAGVAAPSANRFGRVSPTLSEHVRDEFADLVTNGMPVLEGGATEVGIESTIVDLSRIYEGQAPVLLRPGHILPADIESVLGVSLVLRDVNAPRVSGSLKAHYSPSTPMRLIKPQELLEKVRQWCRNNPGKRLAVVRQSHTKSVALPVEVEIDQVVWRSMSDNHHYYAQSLYAQLREIDKLKVDAVFWEDVPDGVTWDGIRDRLHRAAAAFD